MFIFSPSGLLGCDLEFGFGRFQLIISLICVYIMKMFDRAAITRPLCRCRVFRRSKQSRQARGAPGRSSVHTFSARDQAAEPSSAASPAPLHAHVPTTNQENVRMVLPLGRETAAVRRAQKLAPLFSGALAIPLFISGMTP